MGTNTVPADIAKLADLVKAIGADRVQLNTAVRPPSEEYAFAAARNDMNELSKQFDPPAEVLSEFSMNTSESTDVNEADILAMLKRRPCTMEQIAQASGIHRNEASKHIGKLMRTNQVNAQDKDGDVYYVGCVEKEVDHANL